MERELDTTELLGNAAELAIEASEYVFERFHAMDISRGLLVEEQAKLLERRLD